MVGHTALDGGTLNNRGTEFVGVGLDGEGDLESLQQRQQESVKLTREGRRSPNVRQRRMGQYAGAVNRMS